MKKSFRFAAALTLFVLCSCASPPTQRSTEVRVIPSLDYAELQRRLGIETSEGQTGFREVGFDACDLGEALNQLNSPITDCRHAYFVLVRIQLSCRASEQPESVLEDADLRPLVNRNLSWKIGRLSGNLQTDQQGTAVIRAISGKPTRKDFLRVSTGEDFLVMRAGDATTIVTPPSWCN